MSDVIHLPDPAGAQPETMTKKTRSGSERRRRSLLRFFRLTGSEWTALKADADAAGKEPATYAREMALMEPDNHGTSEYATKRPVRLAYRVSEAEGAKLDDLADQARLTPASYVRARALKHSVTLTSRRAPIDRAELARLLALLHLAGSNVNQIARQLNSDGDPDGVQIGEALADLRTAARAIVNSLGRTAE